MKIFFHLLTLISLTLISLTVQGQEWTEISKFHPDLDISPNDAYGYDVITHENYMVVGAPFSPRDGGAKGLVYIYEFIDQDWNLIATLKPSNPEQGSNFGTSLAMDAETITVGAGGSSVFVFSKPETGWADMTETAILSPKTNEFTSYTAFGWNLLVKGDLILVSATSQNVEDVSGESSGIVYIFEKPEIGDWVNAVGETILHPSTYNSGTFYNFFGSSLALKNDQIFVGYEYFSDDYNEQGAIFIFDKPAEGWMTMTESQILVSKSPYEKHRLGREVTVYQDKIIVLGSWVRDNTEDQALGVVFEKTNNTWEEYSQSNLMIKYDGQSYSYPWTVGTNDDHIFITLKHDFDSNNKSSKVNIYPIPPSGTEHHFATGQMLMDRPIIPRNMAFHDNTAIVGALDDKSNGNSGAIYLYEKPITGWEGEINRSFTMSKGSHLTAEDDIFGASVDVSGDYAIVGAFGDDEVSANAGAAYVLKKTEGEWNKVCKLTAPDGKANDNFGWTVAIYNNVIAVGAPGVNQNGQYSGAIYIYEKSSDEWSNSIIPTKVIPEGNEERDYLGRSLDIHKNTIVASGVYTGKSTSRGKVFVIEKEDGSFKSIGQLTTKEQTPEFFGHSVSVFEDKISVVATRSYSAPLIYVYERPENGWSDSEESFSVYSQDNEIGINKSAFIPVINSDSTLFYSNYGPSKLTVDPSTTPWTFKTEYFDGKVIGHKYKDVASLPKAEYYESAYRISASEATAREAYGFSLAQSGNNFVVGNFNDSIDDKRAGKVYVYDTRDLISGETNYETYQIQSSNPEDRAHFGESVAMYGNHLVIGAPSEDNEAGAVYIFETELPYIKSVYSTASGTFKIGDQIPIKVVLSEDSYATGTPALILNMEQAPYSQAVYQGHTGSEIELVYTVEEGNETEGLDYLNEHSFLYGGEIRNGADVEVNRVLPPVGSSMSLRQNSDITIDGIRPEIFISTESNDSINTPFFSIQFTFSEDVTDFSLEDLSLSNTKILSSTNDGNAYELQLEILEDGIAQVWCEKEKFLDLAGNFNAVSESVEVFLDRTPPAITMNWDYEEITNANPILFQVTSDEGITDLDIDDFLVSNGTLSSLDQVSPQIYNGAITNSVDGILSIVLKENSVYDYATNTNETSAKLETNIDRTPPTFSIELLTEMPTHEEYAEIKISFSERIIDFNANDLRTTPYGLSITELTEVGPTEYLLKTKIYKDGLYRIYALADNFKDIADNYNQSIYSNDFIIDTYPTAHINQYQEYFNFHPTFSIDFDQKIKNFNINSFETENCIIESLIIQDYSSRSNAQFTVKPILEGQFSFQVKASSFTDLNGNSNQIASNKIFATYDITGPSIYLTTEVESPTEQNQITIYAHISENFRSIYPYDFVNIENGTQIEPFRRHSGLVYEFSVKPTNDGLVTVTFNTNTIYDYAGNKNSEFSNTLEIEYLTGEELILELSEIPEYTNEKNISTHLLASESVHNIAEEDFEVTNCFVSNISKTEHEKEYIVTITPEEEGEFSLYFKPNGALGDNHNMNINPSNTLSCIFDQTPPSLVNWDFDNQSNQLYLEFSEPVIFNAQNITTIPSAIEVKDFIEVSDKSSYEIGFESSRSIEDFELDSKNIVDYAGNELIDQGNFVLLNALSRNNNVSVYPTPTNKHLHVENGTIHFKSYRIYNTAGRILASGIFESKIDVSGLSSNGIYMIHLISDENTIIKKFIKD